MSTVVDNHVGCIDYGFLGDDFDEVVAGAGL